MKVLSLLQPWASLVIMQQKEYECRSWTTRYRGPLLIHASSKKPSRREKQFFEQAAYFRNYIHDMEELPYGCLIGKVVLQEIYTTSYLLHFMDGRPHHKWQQELAFDDYSPDRFAWHLTDATSLEHFIPVKGTLGLWSYEGRL